MTASGAPQQSLPAARIEAVWFSLATPPIWMPCLHSDPQNLLEALAHEPVRHGADEAVGYSLDLAVASQGLLWGYIVSYHSAKLQRVSANLSALRCALELVIYS